uniref:Predicted protein n=1 Tax=Hordeum vulgare subsp. vulgare TaxID=112509 RepID=F2CPP8_HORVV|nr:predicted protein [Hordeum vulgare subsp. vulgare]
MWCTSPSSNSKDAFRKEHDAINPET